MLPLRTPRKIKPPYRCRPRAQRGAIAQPVRAYGIVAASASNVTSINLPYTARIV
ncbi:MAG: hypothetical protein CPSOU_6279 [uncultured Paraburkholderia sp.]|nr:MAG: hypothetical protein CPSOU_6279 [uncultured Paraburkholderia sp.]